MHEYDTVLKTLLGSPNSILEQIAGVRVARWLETEFAEVQQTRVDLLGLCAGKKKTLIHLELQSTNDPNMAVRMAEYALRVYRRYKKLPEQIVLYVGNRRLQMPDHLKGPTLDYRYKILDIRELEPEELLDSSFATDNVLAILTRLKSRKESIRRILARIAKLERGPREIAFSKLLILAGLRELEDSVRAEAQSMPIMHDIMDHKVIGPAIRQGLKQGRQEGRHEGEVTILHRLIVKRFGTLPSWAEKQLHEMSTEALEDLSPRVLDAKTLDELFGR